MMRGGRDLIDQDPGSGGAMPRERAGSPPPPANPAISSSKKDSAWLSENNITDNFHHLVLNKHPTTDGLGYLKPDHYQYQFSIDEIF